MIRELVLLCLLAVPAIAQEDAEDSPPAAPSLPAPRLVGPRLGPERVKALQRGGGNAATEKAVDGALDWLARHQEDDGSWDADGFAEHCETEDGATEAGGDEADGACTGVGKGQHGEDIPCPFDDAISALATLAFLGRGYLPAEEVTEENPYGPLVARALERLRGTTSRWGLPIATQAFAEVEALERRGRYLDEAKSGAERLLAARGDDGAWAYAGGFRPGSDIPYSAFVAQALVTARDVGVELPADLAPRVRGWMDGLEVEKGRLAYMTEGRRYGYTPTQSNSHCGAAIRCLLEIGDGKQQRSLLAKIAKRRPVWKISFRKHNVPGRGEVMLQMGSLSMYQWWYGTVATFQVGGSSWSGWYGKLKGALVGHRVKSGCARGSWDPVGQYERQTGGRVFATALGALMLEQPYRHRRLSDTPARKKKDEEEK